MAREYIGMYKNAQGIQRKFGIPAYSRVGQNVFQLLRHPDSVREYLDKNKVKFGNVYELSAVEIGRPQEVITV